MPGTEDEWATGVASVLCVGVKHQTDSERKCRISEDQRLGVLFRRIRDVAEGDTVAVRDVVSAIGRRSMVPFLLVPALLTASPLSGIPGFSTVAGLVIVLVSARLLLQFNGMALPDWIERRVIAGDGLRQVIDRSLPVADWIDRHAHPRWEWLFERPFIWLPETLCLISGLMMPMFEFIPFTSSIVALGIVLLALSMLVRDGFLFLFALLPYAGMIALAIGQLT